MSVSGVDSSSYSGISYSSINRTENSKPEIEPAKMYKIGYDRVSKDTYDKYDTDRNNEISKEEETKYKSEKSTQKSDSDKDVEKTEKEPETKKTSLLNNRGNNIDLFA